MSITFYLQIKNTEAAGITVTPRKQLIGCSDSDDNVNICIARSAPMSTMFSAFDIPVTILTDPFFCLEGRESVSVTLIPQLTFLRLQSLTNVDILVLACRVHSDYRVIFEDGAGFPEDVNVDDVICAIVRSLRAHSDDESPPRVTSTVIVIGVGANILCRQLRNHHVLKKTDIHCIDPTGLGVHCSDTGRGEKMLTRMQRIAISSTMRDVLADRPSDHDRLAYSTMLPSFRFGRRFILLPSHPDTSTPDCTGKVSYKRKREEDDIPHASCHSSDSKMTVCFSEHPMRRAHMEVDTTSTLLADDNVVHNDVTLLWCAFVSDSLFRLSCVWISIGVPASDEATFLAPNLSLTLSSSEKTHNGRVPVTLAAEHVKSLPFRKDGCDMSLLRSIESLRNAVRCTGSARVSLLTALYAHDTPIAIRRCEGLTVELNICEVMRSCDFPPEMTATVCAGCVYWLAERRKFDAPVQIKHSAWHIESTVSSNLLPRTSSSKWVVCFVVTDPEESTISAVRSGDGDGDGDIVRFQSRVEQALVSYVRATGDYVPDAKWVYSAFV